MEGPARSIAEPQLKFAEVKPVDNLYGYKPRDSGQRCEGLYEPAVSAPSISLVDLTFGGVPVPDAYKFIRLGAAPRSADRANVVVIGVALVPDTFYRVHGSLKSGTGFSIPVSNVIRPGGLGAYDIGFVGLAGNV